jgi:hypothetical protein
MRIVIPTVAVLAFVGMARVFINGVSPVVETRSESQAEKPAPAAPPPTPTSGWIKGVALVWHSPEAYALSERLRAAGLAAGRSETEMHDLLIKDVTCWLNVGPYIAHKEKGTPITEKDLTAVAIIREFGDWYEMQVLAPKSQQGCHGWVFKFYVTVIQ